MYEPNCGITNLTMSWGHDEYLYHVLKHNKSTLPDKALYIIVSYMFYLVALFILFTLQNVCPVHRDIIHSIHGIHPETTLTLRQPVMRI